MTVAAKRPPEFYPFIGIAMSFVRRRGSAGDLGFDRNLLSLGSIKVYQRLTIYLSLIAASAFASAALCGTIISTVGTFVVDVKPLSLRVSRLLEQC